MLRHLLQVSIEVSLSPYILSHGTFQGSLHVCCVFHIACICTLRPNQCAPPTCAFYLLFSSEQTATTRFLSGRMLNRSIHLLYSLSDGKGFGHSHLPSIYICLFFSPNHRPLHFLSKRTSVLSSWLSSLFLYGALARASRPDTNPSPRPSTISKALSIDPQHSAWVKCLLLLSSIAHQ